MMTLKAAEKKGYVPTKIQIEVLMHPETGNILYPCDGCVTKAYDTYAIISDPLYNDDGKKEDKVVNLVCKKHKKRYQKPSAPTFEGMVRLNLQMLVGKKWEKISQAMVKRMRKSQGWFDWLYPEDDDE